MFGFGRPPRVSSPSLQSLLRESAQPEPNFSSFPPSTVEGTGMTSPSPTSASAPAPLSGSSPPQKKKKSQRGCSRKKSLAAPPTQLTDVDAPPEVPHSGASHRHVTTTDLPLIDVNSFSQVGNAPATSRCQPLSPHCCQLLHSGQHVAGNDPLSVILPVKFF